MNFATCVSRIRLDPCPKFKARFLYTTWIRDALNEELATPPPPCISTEKGNATKVSTLSHVNNLSIIGLEGHRAGGKKRKWRIGREGCQDPAQLGQDVERVAPVNVLPTPGKGHGREVCIGFERVERFLRARPRGSLSFRGQLRESWWKYVSRLLCQLSMNFSNSIVLKTILRKRNFVEIYSNGNWKIWGRVFRGLEKMSG